MWGVKVQPDSESAEKLQIYIFLECPQLYAHETEDAIQTRREHTNPKTHTAAISMSCHRPNRNNTRCTMGGRTKQEESTRIQPWSTQAARVAQEEESNWQTSHGYNPREHERQAGKWVPKTSAKWITQHGVTIHQRTCNASCRTKQDKCWRKTHGAKYKHEYTDSHQTAVMQTSSTKES